MQTLFKNLFNSINILKISLMVKSTKISQKPSDKPKCCIKYNADMLKNLCKATRFDYDTHDCTFNLYSLLDKGWLARL
jgi:hypothetical protein